MIILTLEEKFGFPFYSRKQGPGVAKGLIRN